MLKMWQESMTIQRLTKGFLLDIWSMKPLYVALCLCVCEEFGYLVDYYE